MCSVFYSGAPQANIFSDPPNVSRTVCQPITVTCNVQELQLLRWFFNSVNVATFVLNSQEFPYTLMNNSGIIIQVIDVASESALVDEFNATSVLSTTTLALDLQNVSSVQCGTNRIRSEVIDLTMLDIQGIDFNLKH